MVKNDSNYLAESWDFVYRKLVVNYLRKAIF